MGTRHRIYALREIGIKSVVQERYDKSDGFCFGAARSTRNIIRRIIQLLNRPMNAARSCLDDVGMMVQHP
jgi:hypothetical protein